jgi:hypothetical protein
MPRIDGPTILANVSSITSPLLHLLVLVVAGGAKALQSAEPEAGEITIMRLDMIGNGRRYGERALGAEPTQRLGHQLMPCNASPALRIVEVMIAGLARHWARVSAPLLIVSADDRAGSRVG